MLAANESCKMILEFELSLSSTTVQWKDKQHWSADQLNRSRRSNFLLVVASRQRDSSALGIHP